MTGHRKESKRRYDPEKGQCGLRQFRQDDHHDGDGRTELGDDMDEKLGVKALLEAAEAGARPLSPGDRIRRRPLDLFSRTLRWVRDHRKRLHLE